MFAKNMAQGPRPAKAHPRSAERAQTSQISYFQKRDGPLRFFLAALGSWYRWVYQSKALALCLRAANILLLQ